MKQYDFEIKTTGVITVEAENEKEALEKAEAVYCDNVTDHIDDHDLTLLHTDYQEALEEADAVLKMGDTTVTITEAVEEEGYFYTLWKDGKEVDGGLCTTTIANAIGMALS